MDDAQTERPQLWMLIGGNGSGKSTFYKQYLKQRGLPFVNADEIAKEFYPNDTEKKSREAAKVAERMRRRYLETGKSFCFETVFSHPSKIDFMAQAKSMGYEVIMVYIHLSDASLNKARVHHRVLAGGHSVPEIKIESRIPRTLKNAIAALPLCDFVKVLDNSHDQNRYQPVLTITNGVKQKNTDTLPEWAEAFAN